ncbi:glycosyltransferase [Methylocystis sp. 9N]|uniref:Glycosyltransferase n=1 Tax=Methylocystis borbori TaxID=3118750 RepID=A0ABU7XC35_9HYPH
MRILHLVPTYLPATRYGGPIYSVHGLCKALAARGHEVHVFTTNIDGLGVSSVPLAQPVDLEGVKVWYFPVGLGRRLYRSPAMAKALDEHADGFDILHLHSVFLWPTTFAARLARRRQIPYVLSPRGMLVSELIARKNRLLKSAWIELFERANIAGAATLHLTAPIEVVELQKLRLAARRIDIIPNGVDMPPFEKARSSEASRRAEPPRVLSLGRLNWKKGLDRLILAIARVPQAELVIAGNDEENYRVRLEACARDAGVAERVTFHGPVHGDAKWKLIRSCDLFVMPSYSENFGIAALEAMACGRPVVVTPEVGLAQTVQATGAGVVAEGAPEIFGRAIAALLNAPAERWKMGGIGACIARDQFSWSAIAAQMEAAYGACVGERRSCCN